MGELKITFSGICTHLHNIVPGVPMRSVLPDATAVQFGVFSMAGQELTSTSFYLMPHMAMIRDGYGADAWNQLLTGCYIRVTNAKDKHFRREKGGFSLKEFVDEVHLSSDVVFGGRAMAYVDIFGGRVWHEGGTGDEPMTTHVCMATDGPPEISITPFPNTPLPANGKHIVEHELYITNLDIYPAGEDARFDFLKNYLVTTGGLPQKLMKPTPGMDAPNARPLTLRRLGERLKGLGLFIETMGTVEGWRAAQSHGDEEGALPIDPFGPNSFLGVLAPGAIDPVPLDQSCSDSQYP